MVLDVGAATFSRRAAEASAFRCQVEIELSKIIHPVTRQLNRKR